MSVRDVIAKAIQPTRDRHGQRCPVWTEKADLAECDCWVKPGVYVRSDRAVSYLREAGYLRPGALEEGE